MYVLFICIVHISKNFPFTFLTVTLYPSNFRLWFDAGGVFNSVESNYDIRKASGCFCVEIYILTNQVTEYL